MQRQLALEVKTGGGLCSMPCLMGCWQAYLAVPLNPAKQLPGAQAFLGARTHSLFSARMGESSTAYQSPVKDLHAINGRLNRCLPRSLCDQLSLLAPSFSAPLHAQLPLLHGPVQACMIPCMRAPSCMQPACCAACRRLVQHSGAGVPFRPSCPAPAAHAGFDPAAAPAGLVLQSLDPNSVRMALMPCYVPPAGPGAVAGSLPAPHASVVHHPMLRGRVCDAGLLEATLLGSRLFQELLRQGQLCPFLHAHRASTPCITLSSSEPS